MAAPRTRSPSMPTAWKPRPTGPACDHRKTTPATSAPRTSLPPAGSVRGEPHAYAVPAQLSLTSGHCRGLDHAGRGGTLNEANGQIACRFHARDLNLVMRPAAPATPTRFRVLLDSEPPVTRHGTDVDGDGYGTLAQQRVYQLIRQPGSIAARTFEMTFLDPGAEAYCFTFG